MAATQSLLMPKLGLTMTEGTITEWRVQPGTAFKAGDILVVVETEKIANEVEAPAAGVMGNHLITAGQTVPVGTTIAQWSGAGAVAEAKPAAPAARAAPPTPTPSPIQIQSAGAGSARTAQAKGSRIVATPLARRLASEQGMDLRQITGSGPGGRIKSADLAQAKPAAAPAATGQTAVGAVFFVATEVNAGELLTVKNRLAKIDTVAGVTLAHLACLAVAHALRARPRFNRVWANGEVHQLQSVDVGIAGPTGTVVIANADQLRLSGLVAASTRPDGPSGASAVTVTTAEGSDVTRVGTALMPGRSAALGLGTIRSVFRPDAQGKPLLVQELGLVLTCDSRAFDAATGTAFLNAIKALLEYPLRLLAS